jgi:hypothetical protein
MLRKLLLCCGVLASFVYAGTDVLAAIEFGEYHSFTARVISELMARGAPTERLVDPPFLLYDLLILAFAVGLWRSSPRRRARVTAGLLFAYGAFGLTGPTLFEMNVRGTGDPGADVAHIVATGVLSLMILAAVASGAAIRGRAFRLYSYATLAVLVGFGVLTSLAARGLSSGEPTPWIGLLERVVIGAFLSWTAVLATSFLVAERRHSWEPRPSASHR